jgi:SAM-dependent methyltransferase
VASGGWDESAAAWAAFVDGVDTNREFVLDPVVLARCGDVRGSRVLDVGCGEGRFCRKLYDLGAHTVGLDPTVGLLELARARHPEGEYVEGVAESLPFEDSSFDIVVSYVTLLDMPDYRRAIAEMVRVLRPGGKLIAANLNSVSSTAIKGWHKGPDDEQLHMPVDNYTFEWGAVVEWRGIRIVNYHRPMSDYMDAFLSHGLRLTAYLEPIPTPEAIAEHPRLADYLRVRHFIVLEWAKP